MGSSGVVAVAGAESGVAEATAAASFCDSFFAGCGEGDRDGDESEEAEPESERDRERDSGISDQSHSSSCLQCHGQSQTINQELFTH